MPLLKYKKGVIFIENKSQSHIIKRILWTNSISLFGLSLTYLTLSPLTGSKHTPCLPLRTFVQIVFMCHFNDSGDYSINEYPTDAILCV